MINILNILKNTRNLNDRVFYSPLYGDVKVNIINDKFFPIQVICVKDETMGNRLERDGTYAIGGECMLFPSRDNKDWKNFQMKERYLPKNASVMVRDYAHESWKLIKYEDCINFMGDIEWKYIIPVNKFDFDNFKFNEEDNYGSLSLNSAK